MGASATRVAGERWRHGRRSERARWWLLATLTALAFVADFAVIAASVAVSENEWDIFDSPFEFRSQFRASTS